MKMKERENVNFLIKADPKEFDLESALEAQCMLMDTLEDIVFQLEVTTKTNFKGKDYQAWRTSILYKKNRVASALRKFRDRVYLLKYKGSV